MNGHSNGVSLWNKVEMGPPDSILGLVEAFNKDPSPDKVSLAVGAYRDDDGKPWVLPSVRKAEERVIAANMNKEYAPIVGVMDFVTSARAFALVASRCGRLARISFSLCIESLHTSSYGTPPLGMREPTWTSTYW